MRPRSMRPARLLLPLLPLLALLALASALLPSCGGRPEKEDLRAYEAAMEGLMGEDERVTSALSDLRSDLFAANAKAEDQARYTKTTAAPFYQRFRAAAAAMATKDPLLEAIHGKILLYLSHRLDYLSSIELCLAAAESKPMKDLLEATLAVQEARAALQEKTGGKVDQETAEAFGVGQQFIEKVLDPFRQGRISRDLVEKALQEEVLPRLLRVAARPAGEEGSAGAVTGAWARAEIAFFGVVSASLDMQSRAQEALRASEDHWKQAADLREQYIKELGGYRESLR